MTARRGAGRRASLPVLPAEPPRIRADARRNREKILVAATALFGDREPANVSADDIVAAAGVGKGTLFRIFGDKSGVAHALLDSLETELQRAILDGPPPIGPGVEPWARLGAFLRAYVDYVAAHSKLVTMSQWSRPGRRFETGSHEFWRAHVRYLLREADVPGADFAAEVLLAAVTAEQIVRWVEVEGRQPAGIARALTALARRWALSEA
ncbi:MAG TPA: TetR/AcrR family transcriptional regulator [Jatrophihabitans sp.]|jgi:AcrR family transcriptional regulator